MEICVFRKRWPTSWPRSLQSTIGSPPRMARRFARRRCRRVGFRTTSSPGCTPPLTTMSTRSRRCAPRAAAKTRRRWTRLCASRGRRGPKRWRPWWRRPPTSPCASACATRRSSRLPRATPTFRTRRTRTRPLCASPCFVARRKTRTRPIPMPRRTSMSTSSSTCPISSDSWPLPSRPPTPPWSGCTRPSTAGCFPKTTMTTATARRSLPPTV